MISVQEAAALVAAHCRPLAAVTLSLVQAAGHTLAQDICSPIDVPAFAQVAMDGYCFRFGDHLSHALTIGEEIQAGHPAGAALSPRSALRIFTGAALPLGADTVVMQEKVSIQDGRLVIHDLQLRRGSHVKAAGSEIKRGEPALKKGVLLTPAASGFLASMGITAVSVHSMPSVAIIITGKEIRPPGTPLQPGQVYDANSFALQAALNRSGIRQVTTVYTDDRLAAVEQALQDALQQADAVLLSGGISVGEYDFVLKACEACAVNTVFHKVNQKPGKPLYFGMKEAKPVFGLPGNPAAALTCFYVYVATALAQLAAQPNPIKTLRLPLSEDHSKPPGKAIFLKGLRDGDKVSILPAQESYRLSSFANANCLVCLDETVAIVHQGEPVEVLVLPHG